MVNVKNVFREFFHEITKPKPEKNFDLTRKEAVFTLICALYYLFNRIHVDPSHFTVQRSAVFDVDHSSLFDLTNHPATVERWFQWVTHFQAVDRRPPGVGKQYRAYFYIPYIGYHKVNFTVASYSANSHLVLESKHSLKPLVGLYVTPLDARHTRLTIDITFKHGTVMFQWTIGAYLRYLAGKNIEDALLLLSVISSKDLV